MPMSECAVSRRPRTACGSPAACRARSAARVDQTVSLVHVRGGTTVRISGYCTCPVAVNCKHVVAVVLEICNRLRQKEGLFRPAESAGPDTAAASQPAQLPAAVAEWIDRLGAAVGTPAKAQGASKLNQRELRFVLNPLDASAGNGAAAARMRAVKVRLRKDGGIIEEKRCDSNIASCRRCICRST